MMRICKCCLWISTAVLILCGRTAKAWNSCGHETVALIAYDQLSPTDRAALVDILQHHPRRDADLLKIAQPKDDQNVVLFIAAATWPDIVRSPVNPLNRSEHHPQWHYVDFPFELDGVKGPQPALLWDGKSDPQNLLEAMQKVELEFVDHRTTPERRAIALCWIEHLTGDIHQPLHAASLYSNDFPTGDHGGNLVYYKTPQNQPSNLHWYWDSLEGTKLNLADIRVIADRVEKEHPVMSLQQDLTKMAVKEWADESFDLAKGVVYNNGQIPGVPRQKAMEQQNAPSLTDAYQAKAHETADLRIALGGYRLAATLQNLLTQSRNAAATQPTTQR